MTQIYHCHMLLILLFNCIGNDRTVSAQTEPDDTIDTDDGFRLELFDVVNDGQLSAQENCKMRGGRGRLDEGWLVRVKDKNLQEHVENLTRNCTSGDENDFYIGLEYDNGWFWNDATKLTEAQKNWAPSEGSDENQDCACLQATDGKWLDVACDEKRRFICQSELIYIEVQYEELTVIEGAFTEFDSTVITRSDDVDVKLYNRLDIELTSTTVTPNDKTGKILNYTIASPVADRDDGEYKFVASTQNEPHYNRSAITRLIVHVPAKITTLPPTSIRSPVTVGLSFAICIAYGFPTPTVTWKRNGFHVTTSATVSVYQEVQSAMAILHVENAALSDHGTYTCEAENKVGTLEAVKRDSAETQLSVLGSPIIISSAGNECTEGSKITVRWKANNQTLNVLHKFEAVNLNDTDKPSNTQNITTTSDDEIVTKIENLSPYTTYGILITVCPDECIKRLNASSIATTAAGVPNAVKEASVSQIAPNSSCVISWNWSDIYPLETVTFEINETSRIVYSITNEEQPQATSTKIKGESVESLQFTAKTDPNRNYTFAIRVETCAGASEAVEAIGKCITEVAAPDNVTNAVMLQPDGDTQPIKVQIPSETNGPISCIFVIMASGNDPTLTTEFSEDILQEFSNSATNGEPENGTEYIAAAIPRIDVTNDTFIVYLGDGNETTCKTTMTDMRQAKATSYRGKNWSLQKGFNYTYYTLITIPYQTKDGISFEASESSGFKFGDLSDDPEEYNNTEDLWWIILLAVVLSTALVIAIFLAYKYLDNSKKGNCCKTTTDLPEETLPPGTAESLIPVAVPPVQKYKHRRHPSAQKLLNLFEELNRNNGEGFAKKFQVMQKSSNRTTAMASQEAVVKKNRYKNVLPYDDTRVVLSGGGVVDSYINACHIDGYRRQKKFIATQGPLTKTIDDFWRMVTEQATRVIVMLTNLEEGGKKKCAKYWPEIGNPRTHGNVHIANEGERYFGGFMKRDLKIHTPNGKEFKIEQFHYLKWPDHGVPVTTSSFVRFYKACMESQGGSKSPMIVHCSAGAGRTGTFIGYDYLVEEFKKTNHIDVDNCVMRMRDQRMDMVQSCSQYKLLHKLLLEYAMFGDTDMNESELHTKMNLAKSQRTLFEAEFKNIEEASSISKISDSEDGNVFNVVILYSPDDGDSVPKYDASYVENYYNERKIIAAKGPGSHEIETFWRIILDNEVKYIVMINDGNEEPVGYWPKEKSELYNVGSISTELTECNNMSRITERKMIVRRSRQEEEVIQYQVLKWTPDVIERVIFKIKGAVSTAIKSRSNVIVHCSNGKGRTGMFCAFINLFQRLENEHRLDVFRAVKDLREFRDGMVEDKAQYKFCHEVIDHWLQHRPEASYENFAVTKRKESLTMSTMV